MNFDLRNPEYQSNPYPFFKRLRMEAPIVRLEPQGFWAVSRYEDVLSLLKAPEIFSSAGLQEEPQIIGTDLLLQARGLVGMDRPDHTRLRRVISRVLTPEKINGFEPLIQSTVQELLEAWKGEVEFIGDFAAPLPITVIAEFLGLDPALRKDFKRWCDTLLTWRSTERIEDPEERRQKENSIQSDISQMFECLSAVVAERRRAPQADFISELVAQSLTPQEIFSFIRFLLVAGTDTTSHLLGNTLLALLNQPPLQQEIRKHPKKIPTLIEEVLRWDSPVLSLIRRTTEDTEIRRVKIPQNEVVLALVASANHDESVFVNPGTFDLDRSSRAHLTFGAGVHFCLGSQLARMQARIAFEELLPLLDALKPNPFPSEYVQSFFFRGVKKLNLSLS